MTLLADRRRIIERHQTSWPVQTVPMANDLGLKVYNARQWPDDVSGMLKRDKDAGGLSGFAIYVNASHHRKRRRFTIAHEVAHFVLHESLVGSGIVEDRLMRAEGFSSTIETEANRFAADILMPWELLDRARSEDLTTIEELSEAFDVSKDAMSIRLYKTAFIDDI